jgi:hypothetical protein
MWSWNTAMKAGACTTDRRSCVREIGFTSSLSHKLRTYPKSASRVFTCPFRILCTRRYPLPAQRKYGQSGCSEGKYTPLPSSTTRKEWNKLSQRSDADERAQTVSCTTCATATASFGAGRAAPPSPPLPPTGRSIHRHMMSPKVAQVSSSLLDAWGEMSVWKSEEGGRRWWEACARCWKARGKGVKMDLHEGHVAGRQQFAGRVHRVER